jgi:Ca2+-binding RTX toxin-like protein
MPTQTGTPGNDFLEGTPGADVLIGLGGDDIYIVDDVNDQVVEASGEGFDTVYASVNYALAAGSYIERLAARDNGLTIPLILTGNEIANYIFGNNGANQLDGGAGNDVLQGFGGADVYFVDSALDVIIEFDGGGSDIVRSSVTFALGGASEVETLAARDAAATTALALIGNEYANTILGNAGNNFLDGNTGADILTGFGGDDAYAVDNISDVVNEAAGAGNDTVYATTSYTLAAGTSVETLASRDIVALTAMTLTGNELGNTIVGNNGANTLDGGAGNDVLAGFGGDDIYLVDSALDVVIELNGGGSDTVRASVTFALGGASEVETLETRDVASTAAIALYGNEYANTIRGNAGNNFLDGNIGVDILTGFGGDDAYAVDNAGDVVNEVAGGGTDAVYSTVDYVLAAGISVETLSVRDNGATNTQSLTGNELANIVVGNNGINTLDGKGGNDTLWGFGGADNFAFTTTLGAGNVDTIIDFTPGADKILLGGAAGQPFLTLATGALRSGTLVIGSAALDADDYLIYNSGTGALLYDADGNGAGAAVQFATLSTGLNLNAADFLVSGTANTAPAITSGATASVAENSAASNIVYQLAANDADGDRVTYALTGADAALLTIDASGAVRLINPADFEAKSSYAFNVVASDSAVATTKAVTLTVTDVVESGPTTTTIDETANLNDTRQTAQALDRGTFNIATNVNLPNDDLPSATIIGSISSLSDKDFFSITLQAGEQLILDVDGTTTLDSFLTLYKSGGGVIGDNDDLITPDPGSGSQFGHNTDSQIIFRAATSGTYYFSIGSFEDDAGPTSQGAYQINVSIGPVATAAQIMAEDVDALISGDSWNHTNLTYGFPTLASYYPSGFDEVSSSGSGDPVPVFEAFTPLQVAATQSLLQLIANVSTLTFTQNVTQGAFSTPGTAANANLRYAESDEAEVAYAYYPTNGGPSSVGGSAWFNHEDFDDPIRGDYAWMGILHETGHALGLKHGHEFPLAISADHDSVEYSVMTYRSFPGGNVSGGYTNETWGYPQTLMMLDIAALQKIYDGANYTFNASNSVYTWSATTGEMSINGTGQGAPGNGAGGSANRVFMTIWDGGGDDTYDLSNYAGGTTIDLRPGEWTTTAQAQLANLGQSHFARGNVANALLFEGNTASAIENATGGSGGDTLIANLVANQLRGNGGADIFKWAANGDAGTGLLADSVQDFVRGSDKIDLTGLDANPATGAHDAFTFIGTSAFHNVAGEVRYEVTGGSAHIFADADGNGVADMEIVLSGITTLAGTDFNF